MKTEFAFLRADFYPWFVSDRLHTRQAIEERRNWQECPKLPFNEVKGRLTVRVTDF